MPFRFPFLALGMANLRQDFHRQLRINGSFRNHLIQRICESVSQPVMEVEMSVSRTARE